MAMGKEEVRAARGAIVSHQDVRRLHPGGRKLVPGHGGEVEARGGNMFGRVPRRVGAQEENRVAVGGGLGPIGQFLEEGIRTRESSVESFHNFLAHFDSSRRESRAPRAAISFCGSEPNARRISPTAFSITRARAPRQPAWTAATARCCGSTSSTGRQSAIRMVKRTPGSAVIKPSPAGRAVHRGNRAFDAGQLVGRMAARVARDHE